MPLDTSLTDADMLLVNRGATNPFHCDRQDVEPQVAQIDRPCSQLVKQSVLSRSLLQMSADYKTQAGASELLSILQKEGESPVRSFLGFSPPVRGGWQGGATNPLAHISLEGGWTQAFNSNLQLLGEFELGCNAPAMRDLEHQSLFQTMGSSDLQMDGIPIRPSCRHASMNQFGGAMDQQQCQPFNCHVEYYAI
eukprot:gene4610-14803_t